MSVKSFFMKMFMVFALTATTIAANAQEKVEFGAAGDVVSKYLWRGQNYANVSVQPSAWLSYKGFSFTVWGSTGFTKDDMAEIDLILSYEKDGFYASITDYWCAYYGDGTKYFSYKGHSTPHVFEATVGYDFGFLDKIGLKEHLSPTRSNGLVSMVEKMKAYAILKLKCES